ncbi:hypothetical protein GGI42DRAFT_316652 [Trichoderma sp. SZMC 28013]
MSPATSTSTSTLTPSRWLATGAGQWHSIPAERLARHVSQADVTAPETVISAVTAAPSQLLHLLRPDTQTSETSVGRAQVSLWGMRRPQPTQSRLGSSSMHSSACFSYLPYGRYHWYLVPLPRGQLYDTG